MPVTPKGAEIKRAMVKQYGKKKGAQVFYASEKAGTIKGVHKKSRKKAARSRKKIGGR